MRVVSTAQLSSLQSADELGLLDAVDKLRSHGISHYIQLPQVIVCGDQSSGKSSVLEAISGIPFPTKDSLCTRFPTEVILRRAQAVSGTISIVPSQGRPEAECLRLSQYSSSLTDFNELGEIMETANQLMGISSSPGAFSDDVLRVEITGPDQPHLTIVDLPGLIHSENKVQTAADVDMIQRMVRNYMENRRSIILAIVSAKNDLANQIVLKLAKKYDPKGLRTLGIITKPDTLPVGSDSEMAFASLARNEDVDFRLGWHVVRNRNYEERETTLDDRDAVEQDFFTKGVWADFPRIAVGVPSLRPRLSKVLLDQIKTELPSVVSEIERKLEECSRKRDKLGPSRATPEEQQKFLLGISETFSTLTKSAADGVYMDQFFGDAESEEGYAKRIRAVVQNRNRNFEAEVRRNGHFWTILANQDPPPPADIEGDVGGNGSPIIISRAKMIDYTKTILRRTRGRELPGLFNPMIVTDLFRKQSTRWEQLARNHVMSIWEQCLIFLGHVTRSLTDEKTSERIHETVIFPHMESNLKQLNDKVTELLRTYSTGHPITYNHYFTENIQNIRAARIEAAIRRQIQQHLGLTEGNSYMPSQHINISSLVAGLVELNKADMDEYACSEILDCMEAYYKVAMKTMVDNVCTLAIETVLASGLQDLFSPSTVVQMTMTAISGIAAESEADSSHRDQLSRQCAALQLGLYICKAQVGYGATSLRIDDEAESVPSRSLASSMHESFDVDDEE